MYWLTMVWVHPYQARVSTIDDVARKLTLLASSRPDWPYVFVWFNGDAHHVPLPKESHLSAITEGMPSNTLCIRIYQLEIHHLLHSEALVVYPKGLNGCLVPVITSLPESLSHGMTMLVTSLPSCKGTSCSSQWKDMSPRPPSSVVVQPLLPPHVLLWHLPPKWRVKSAWSWRSVNSYCRWLWTPSVKHRGVPPLKDQCPWSYEHHPLSG